MERVIFELRYDSNKCTAHLQLNDSIEPSSSEIARKINSSYFANSSVLLLENKSVELPSNFVPFEEDGKNISINVEYSFKTTNYSINQQTWAKVGTLTSDDAILRNTLSQMRLMFLD